VFGASRPITLATMYEFSRKACGWFSRSHMRRQYVFIIGCLLQYEKFETMVSCCNAAQTQK